MIKRTSSRKYQDEGGFGETVEGVRSDWIPKETAAHKVGARKAHGEPETWIRPSVPREQRRLGRVSQRELGKVVMSVRLPGGDWVTVKLWDFSSIGFGILCGETPGWASAGGLNLKEGDEVLISIRVKAHQRFEVWCEVRNLAPLGKGIKIGLRRLDIGMPQPVNTDRREVFRLPLAPALALKARIRHPFLYGHVSALRVSDLNRNLGVSFVSHDAEILLFEGMELEVCFDLAGLRSSVMQARVVWVHATEADEVKFGVECTGMDWRLHRGLCNYLFYTRNWTPSRLREAGFKVQQVKGHLRFRAVKTMEQYAEVLRLRRDAYVSVGKRTETTTPEEMASALDGISRILMARHHGQVVGSLTFTFPPDEETRLDSEAGFPGGKYPVKLPPKNSIIEVSRLCIREDYRGTDLLQGLFEQGLKHFLLSDRNWLLTSATQELLPLYESIGFRRLGASYYHPGLNMSEHHLIIAPKRAFLRGAGMGLLAWNSVFGDLVGHLLRHRLISINRWTEALIRCKLLFRPLARLAQDGKTRRAFSKHLKALRQEGR